MFKTGNIQGAFGAPNNNSQGLFGGAPKTNAPGGFGVSPFGANQQTNPGGVFGNQQQNAGFGNNGAPQAQGNGLQGNGQQGMFQQQGSQPSIFGAAQQPSTTSMFGNPVGQQQQGQNPFGAPQPQNQGSPFGTQQTNPTNPGLFGAQQPPNNGIFGNGQGGNAGTAVNSQPAGLFGQNGQQSNGLFGQNAQQNPQQSTGMFGAGNQQNQNRPNGLFGNSPQTTGTGIFGNQQAQTQQQTSPFGAVNQQTTSPFGNPQQQQQGIFNGFGTNTPQQPQANSPFGQTGNTGLFNTNNNAKLAGTDWGVPTNLNPGNSFNTNSQPFQPVKTKNPKLEGKHTIKCLTALDQFTGMCKEEVRISFVTSGGQQPTFQQQQGSNAFKNAGNPPQTNFFGQPQQTTAMIAQNKPMGTSIFGQNAQQTPSLFGTNPTQPMQGAFGQQPHNSLFGATQPAGQTAPNSLFGLFGQQTPSLLGPAQNQPNQGATSFFGQQPQANPPQNSLFNQGQTQSLFTAQPQPSFFTQPQQQNAMAQLSNPLFQGQVQSLDPSLQILLPQLLLSYAINQPTSTPSNLDPNHNPTMDLLSKLTTLIHQINPHTSQASPANPSSSPFDDFMKEARGDYSLAKPKENEYSYSLFSDFEKEPNYYLESSFTSQHSKRQDEPFYIQSIHKTQKREEIIQTEEVYRQVSKKYKTNQEHGKAKLSSALNDLPRVGKFSTFPSLDRLKKYSSDQLKEVRHFKLWNQYGEIQFCEPISLLRLDLQSVFIISQDNIEITNSELQEKRFRMTFRNFGNYSNLKGEERERVVRRMRTWIGKGGMKEIRHDDHNGDLVVEVGN